VDQLTSMRVFANVVELGSFARAGVKLDMSPATVTTHVRSLENRLGVRLLHRTTRRLSLTDEGRLFFDRCRTIIAEVDETEELVSAARPAPRGRLRVDVPVAVAHLFLTGALPEFLQRYPDLRLEVGVTDCMVNLVAEAVDCAIRVSLAPALDASMVAREIGPTRLVTVASPG
jgi:LysR family transcriptional regulator for bpeEF and oprC